jgi:adenylate kinase family enzyme
MILTFLDPKKMTYAKYIRARAKNPSHWPAIDNPDLLDQLSTIADDSFSQRTMEGYLASMLLYQQLCEEMLRLLELDAQFIIQLSVYPFEINFAEKKRRTFGSLINDLDKTISFKEKRELISNATKLNELRNQLVHRLTSTSPIIDIRSKVKKAKKLHDKIFDLFKDAHDHFQQCMKDLTKDRF